MKNNLSKNLKKLRKEEGLSQEQLADLLNVSRQSVSKWETEDAYPEMDKIIFLCNKFDLDINDLLNGDIYEVKHKKDAVKDVYKVIDKIVKFFVDLFSLFFKMTFKSKIKFVFEIFFLTLVLGTSFWFFGELLSEAFRHFFYSVFPNKVYFIIIKSLSSIYYIISMILSIAILMEIIKNRYLKYYRENKEEPKDISDNEMDNDYENKKVELKQKENKIIIRNYSDSEYRVINLLYDGIVIFSKFLLSVLLIPLIMFLIFLAFGLISSFIVYKTGFFFIGLLLVILSSMIITSLFILLIANFVFGRKNNFKIFIYSSIINLIVLGLGVGFIFVGTLSFNIINNYDTQTFITAEQTITMNKNLEIDTSNIAGEIQYIEEDRKDIRIEYDYNKTIFSNIYKVNIRTFESKGKHIIYLSNDQNNSYEIFKSILTNLNDTKTINYSENLYHLKIYGSKNNLKIIKNNIEKND